ncbi:MAG TPA: L,D-transpeptidase family protein [Candidatus Acidoferrales bacterium]|nr:L,D-transpeptidase family protein [Candidatus Acidoferrales bacterium]
MRSIIESGRLDDLRWPEFRGYQADIATFYQSYRYALPWIRDMQATNQARAVIEALSRADEKGLSPDDYDGPRWADRLARLQPNTSQTDEAGTVRFDVALTVSLMHYVSDLHTGRIDPHLFGIDVNIAKRKCDLPKFLSEQIVPAADVRAALLRVEPSYPGYERTIRALETYRRLAKEKTGQPFPATNRAIAPGQSYSSAPRLRQFLQLVGDLAADAPIPSDETKYDSALADAVRRFQERHGLTPDGRIGPKTLEELNVPLESRVRQIELTLERWRWLPAQYGEAPIVVNIPGFMLRAYDDAFHVAVTMKVVVGRAYDHETPIFMSRLQSVVFRPYWDIPVSIAREEIVPAIEDDPEYLAKQNMEIVNGRGEVVATDTVNRHLLNQIGAGSLSVRQKPGPNNALGLIKFQFPNEYSVYMHDTPARLLFSRSQRDFSHGCIRLEKPEELAGWVLRDNPGWDPDRILAAMNGEATLEVKLVHPIPVLVVYGTAIDLEDGIVRFYDDIYGQDAKLEEALRSEYPYPH